MKVKDMWLSRPSLAKVLRSPNLDAHVAFRLAPLYGRMIELEKAVTQLIEGFETKVTEDGLIQIIDSDRKAYQEKFDALMEEELRIEVPKLNIKEIEPADPSAEDMWLLNWLISDPK